MTTETEYEEKKQPPIMLRKKKYLNYFLLSIVKVGLRTYVSTTFEKITNVGNLKFSTLSLNV